uniref:Uncharacterized protein n=1 Tax=Entomoneis paludosa TaxID=265537 RepID=A0A7S3DXE6_9STRA|mmetsp:Transcript_7474/g.15608  ORF Transcript_7474/g.15608 Transcript_7474/m.15608 type:complete len:671 (+) Transcript_7474:97-2109(+)|eukprot:CAMPEP_0172448056 /NCGR_PEP_ID=MMETSP1065-20121228/7149_1 /TAXON_ID=265537 /ORGANISM="Amphiprora paludosa, Strain CCMP125" /LENGTH=670 /DNA_ID=CAMNT_0013199443 /DNA_START=32 /DNA_END=2044 /DNA_ORIENTATION=+
MTGQAQQNKHVMEDEESWDLHWTRRSAAITSDEDKPEAMSPVSPAEEEPQHLRKRNLKHHGSHHHHRHPSMLATDDALALEAQKEQDFWTQYKREQRLNAAQHNAEMEQHDARMNELYANPGIAPATVHGLMIDAGSTGSRLHIYEWEPRTLANRKEITSAVSGDRISFPGTESRWTDRLRPGLDTFSSYADQQELDAAMEAYLKPLFDFAKSVLHAKQADFGNYPVFLRATAGMRILPADDRARVMASVRRVLNNVQFNPFLFQNEQARTLSGEEEAIYDWAGVNFLLGDLVEQSTGAGTVVNPQKTHGALDLGGGSTQISFYEPHEDIMSNLFKFQIGQAKHWNLYAHSFLFFGMNEAIHRHQATLAAGKTSKERVVDGIYDPCLPKGAKSDVRSDIHLSAEGFETWTYNETYPSGTGFYQATLYNDGKDAESDVKQCLALAKDLLHLENNKWCNFSHKGDCSLAGVYQPQLPTKSESFGEFIAFSNYHHVWKFLHLKERATIQQLYDATQHACSLNHDDLKVFARGKVEDDQLDSYCFRSAYVFQLLHNGYGFQMNDTIRVSNVINGKKVGWALGAMLYEINTLPWTIENETSQMLPSHKHHHPASKASLQGVFIGFIAAVMALSLTVVFFLRWRRQVLYQQQYEPVKEASNSSSRGKESSPLIPRV